MVDEEFSRGSRGPPNSVMVGIARSMPGLRNVTGSINELLRAV